jgi:hypothetical protein
MKKIIRNIISRYDMARIGIDPKQLEMGIKVEREHKGTIDKIRKNLDLPDEEIFEMIAKDHLAESPLYYTLLERMESEFEK